MSKFRQMTTGKNIFMYKPKYPKLNKILQKHYKQIKKHISVNYYPWIKNLIQKLKIEINKIKLYILPVKQIE